MSIFHVQKRETMKTDSSINVVNAVKWKHTSPQQNWQITDKKM